MNELALVGGLALILGVLWMARRPPGRQAGERASAWYPDGHGGGPEGGSFDSDCGDGGD